MATIARHGSEIHVLRPDGVYRTSVIQPFVGFSPQADVQAIAAQFTTGGPLATQLSGGLGGLGAGPVSPCGAFQYDAQFAQHQANASWTAYRACLTREQHTRGSGQRMAGLGGLGYVGPIQGLILRIKARFAARRAAKFMAANAAAAAANGTAGFGHGPDPDLVVASQVAPQMHSQMTMLEHLMHSSNSHIRGPVKRAAEILANRRPFTYYRAG